MVSSGDSAYFTPEDRVYFTRALTPEFPGHPAFSNLWVEFPRSGHMLVLPLRPSNAVEDALPCLEPAFAYYASKWQQYPVSPVQDPKSLFAHVPETVSDRMVKEGKGDELAAIVDRHTLEEERRILAPVGVKAVEPLYNHLTRWPRWKKAQSAADFGVPDWPGE